MLLMLVSGCGGIIDDSRGVITVSRQSDTDCVWLISAPVGGRIKVGQFASCNAISFCRPYSLIFFQFYSLYFLFCIFCILSELVVYLANSFRDFCFTSKDVID